MTCRPQRLPRCGTTRLEGGNLRLNAKLCGSKARAILRRPGAPTQAFHFTDSNFRAESVNRGRCWTKPVPWDRKTDGAPPWAPRSPPSTPRRPISQEQLQCSDAPARRSLPRFFDPKRWVTPGNHWNRLTSGFTAGWSWYEEVDSWPSGRPKVRSRPWRFRLHLAHHPCGCGINGLENRYLNLS